MKSYFYFIMISIGFLSCIETHAQVPTPKSGRIIRHDNFPSNYVNPRHVDVWLPDNFESLKAAGQRFNVIYMHDGQMLFDATTTWNKQEWMVDDVLSKLTSENKIESSTILCFVIS